VIDKIDLQLMPISINLSTAFFAQNVRFIYLLEPLYAKITAVQNSRALEDILKTLKKVKNKG
jgi:hypothetical protein